MGGLDNLAELKVLNLAGNQIRKISNMQGLISLEELNIRRNRIRSTTGLVSTTLEKLFISNNELQVYLIRGATGKAHAPMPDKTPITVMRRRFLFFKIKVRPRSCRSYPLWRPWPIHLPISKKQINRFAITL